MLTRMIEAVDCVLQEREDLKITTSLGCLAQYVEYRSATKVRVLIKSSR